MRVHLENYRKIVGEEVIEDIYEKASRVKGKHIVHINSTYQGGGVAEILNTLVLLMEDVGVHTGWRVLHGNPGFFAITKKFHNSLQGAPIHLTDRKKDIYESVNENFSIFTHLDHDLVLVHDPQPLPLINFYEKKQPWVWRLHIDISRLNNGGEQLFSYLKGFILKYDAMVVSMDSYKKDIPLRQEVIRPSIDPLSNKNKPLPKRECEKILSKHGVDLDKPIITQVSRFDRFKDPEGVVKVFKKVRESHDCQLVLIGSMASDDPESEEIYRRMVIDHDKNPDIKIISATNDVLVNALQRVSACVLQKSTREGFALTVSEALWKGTPVVASDVGGIPAQIQDGVNGYLVSPTDYTGCAKRVSKILGDEKLAHTMGVKGKEVVRENFLITRHLRDYLALFDSLLND